MLPIHPFLIWFLWLGVIPVILHLLLKAKPKKLIFPALRLIQNRQRQNTQKMRLKHFWLMLLRIAAIMVLVFALARPRIPAANYWPNVFEWSTLGIIVATALGAWFIMTRRWKRAALPAHHLQHRRSLLRSGIIGAVVLLIVLGVLWPLQRRVMAQIKDPGKPINENAPVASIMLFDTSPSMQYRQAGQTRLEVALELAQQYQKRLPSGSRLAVADTSSTNPIVFLPDMAAAASRMAGIENKNLTFSFNERLRTSLELHKEDQSRVMEAETGVPEAERQDAFVREIVVFTDMSPAQWQQSATNLLKADLARELGISLYLIDVSIPQPVNIGLSDLKVLESTLTSGGELRVQATVSATGKETAKATVDLMLPSEGGQLVRKASQTVDLHGTEGVILPPLAVRGITGNIVQGEIRLTSDDPLEFDNVLYFTVEVVPAQEILVVSDVIQDGQYWATALAPPAMQKRGRTKYRCTQLSSSKLGETDLSKYAAISLINVKKPTERDWKKVADYVEAGGGVVVCLGAKVDPVAYNLPVAKSFLPAELLAHLRYTPPEYIDLTNSLDHPLLKKFADWGAGALTNCEIYRYWRVKPLPTASVIAWYTSQMKAPAILERAVGKGRTVLLTTGVSRTGADQPSEEWNDIPQSSWVLIGFADQTMRYLSRQAQGPFNYVCGEDAIVRLDPEKPITNYLLRKPNSQQLPGELAPGKSSLVIRTVDQFGQFRFLDATPGSKFERGFSVNPQSRENILTPISQAELDEILGKDRYSIGKTFDQLEKKTTGNRIGLEIFPFLIFVMWLVFVGEHLVANRFYDQEKSLA
ncbi:MAG: hypothetical protein JWM11_3780 [Planctomycetaceae bacterium]|nr:hypothetical protein [Planctomycetaceae bacterium]